MASGKSLIQILLPKKKTNPKGVSYTSTFAGTTDVLTAPTYKAHLTNIFDDRISQDSRELLKNLFKFDSDVSAALHAYLNIANTTPRFLVYDQNDQLDRAGQQQFVSIQKSLTQRNDYSTGFAFTKSMRQIAEELRYMALLRGGFSNELVFNKLLQPVEFRQVDVVTLNWYEKSPGVYKPTQTPAAASGGDEINLDIANFFVKYYRQNPTEIYSESMFVSSINTIAARQQVINDLYRIMQKTGYPRIEAKVLEEVLRKNAPAEYQQDEGKMIPWLNQRMSDISNNLTDMTPDQAYVHTDAIEAKILNDKGPGTSMNVESIITVLDAQNQAALKVMGSVIGKGEKGVNTASVEARIFSLAAESLNGPIADMLSEAMTLAMRLTGYQGYVVCTFDPVELRPATELEPQLIMRQTRLQSDLSLGILTDDEYHLMMYNRPRPDSAPELSGTGFAQPTAGESAASANASKVSPNSDPLGKSIAAPGGKSARSNGVNK